MSSAAHPVLGDTTDTDVCVIGAGPAGLMFARELAGTSLRVLVLESGGWTQQDSADEQAGAAVDSAYYEVGAIASGRRRQFGGTTNIWSHVTRPDSGRVYARALPAEAVDFEDRAWQLAGGWPIDLTELTPYYEQVTRRWFGRPLENEPRTWSRPGTPVLPLRPGPVTTKMAQYGPADVFTLRYRDELLQSDNVEVQVDSTVVELESDGGAQVRRARVLRADGSTYLVQAKVFVLAGGGIENVQTLLHSAPTRPGGPGNLHDNVGRYVTDHPEFLLGTITPVDPGLVETIGLYDMHYVDDFLVSGVLTLSEEVKRDEKLLNMAAVLLPQPAGFGSDAERAIRAMKPLRSGRAPQQPVAALRSIAGAPRDAASVLRSRVARRLHGGGDYAGGYVWHRGGWSRPEVDRSALPVIEVHAATEQSPERDNQLTLGERRDSLGRRRLRLRLQWSAADRENVLRTMRTFAAEIEGSGLGSFQRWVEFTGTTRPVNDGVHHPMGGTRMNVDPRVGVVDENCKVHGVPNVYVAGSSVFATGLGYANPTLTLLALSTRLADHVQGVLGVPSRVDRFDGRSGTMGRCPTA